MRFAVLLLGLVAVYGLAFLSAMMTMRVPVLIAVLSVPLAFGLLALSVIDAKTQVLPNAVTLSVGGCGLIATAIVGVAPLWAHLIAAILGGVLFWAVDELYVRLRGRHGLGGGDAKLFAAAGAWLGQSGLPTVLLWACGSAILTVVVKRLVFREGITTTDRIPFGPHLAFGIWLVWLFGPLQ